MGKDPYVAVYTVTCDHPHQLCPCLDGVVQKVVGPFSVIKGAESYIANIKPDVQWTSIEVVRLQGLGPASAIAQPQVVDSSLSTNGSLVVFYLVPNDRSRQEDSRIVHSVHGPILGEDAAIQFAMENHQDDVIDLYDDLGYYYHYAVLAPGRQHKISSSLLEWRM